MPFANNVVSFEKTGGKVMPVTTNSKRIDLCEERCNENHGLILSAQMAYTFVNDIPDINMINGRIVFKKKSIAVIIGR